MGVTLKIDNGAVIVYKNKKYYGSIGGNASNAYIKDGQIIIEKSNGGYSVYDFNLHYLGGGGSAKPIKSSKSYIPNVISNTDKLDVLVVKIILILFLAFLFFVSPGILIYDIFSNIPTNFSGKWWQVALISLVLLGSSLMISKNEISKGLNIYAIFCVLSSITLLVWWYFFNGAPLSGSSGHWF